MERKRLFCKGMHTHHQHLMAEAPMVTKWARSGMPVHTRGRGVASQFRLRDVRAWLKVREAKAKAAEKAKVREAKAAEKAQKTAKQ